MQLVGLHHVTAVTGHASQNLNFYTQVLGLRLVKKTVNQDDIYAYHLFYADSVGSPGTDVTFFDWPNVVKNQNGAGSIAQIALRVSGSEALDWWTQRFTEAGVPYHEASNEGGRRKVRFTDPEGLELALVDDGGALGGVPWEGSPVPVEHGIRGLDSVLLKVRDLEPLSDVLTKVMGFHLSDECIGEDDHNRRFAIFSIGEGGPGAEVHVEWGPHLAPGRLGRGGVHHVAFRTPDAEEQLAWREAIAATGLNVTPVIDRFYFKSIYFRVPGGILFEIATDGPGFAADEDINHLGENLALPPFLESQRARIEANLHPLEAEA